MSSKKAKAARKIVQKLNASPYEDFGISTGVKIQGRNVNVALALYEAGAIEETYSANSVKFEFSPLTEKPNLYGSLAEMTEAGFFDDDLTRFEGLSLGVILLADRSKIVNEGERMFLDAETLPFLVGDSRMWRNPKWGSIFSDDEVSDAIRSDDFYSHVFPAFRNIYKIEQIVSLEPISDSQDSLIDTRIGGIFGAKSL